MLGGALVLVMLLIATVVYRDSRQSTYGTAYIAAAGDMRMLSQRLAKASSLALLGDPTAFKQLRESRDSFAANLEGLTNGGELAATQLPPSPDSVQPQLKTTDTDLGEDREKRLAPARDGKKSDLARQGRVFDQ
jgi:twitching motility protein PilJ